MSGPEQKMQAWVVSLVFASGKNVVRTCIAPSSEAAAAIVTHGMTLDENLREETTLVSVLSAQLGEDWLRAAHRIVVKGGKPEGEVVKLVSNNVRTPDPEASEAVKSIRQVLAGLHEWNPQVFGSRCTKCGGEWGYEAGTVCPGVPPSPGAA